MRGDPFRDQPRVRADRGSRRTKRGTILSSPGLSLATTPPSAALEHQCVESCSQHCAYKTLAALASSSLVPHLPEPVSQCSPGTAGMGGRASLCTLSCSRQGDQALRDEVVDGPEMSCTEQAHPYWPPPTGWVVWVTRRPGSSPTRGSAQARASDSGCPLTRSHTLSQRGSAQVPSCLCQHLLGETPSQVF